MKWVALVVMGITMLYLSSIAAAEIVTLQDANTENIDDCYTVNVTHDDDEIGIDPILISQENSTIQYDSFIKFNISSLMADININDAELCLYVKNNYFDSPTEGHNISAFMIYHNYSIDSLEWNEGNSASWVAAAPGEMNWNEMPGSGYYRPNADDTIKFNNANTGWQCWNITKSVILRYSSNYENVSIWLMGHDVFGTPEKFDYVTFYSKEYLVDTSLRPYLNITYSYQDNPTYWYPVNLTITEYEPNTAFTINVTWNISGASYSVDSVWIEGNWSGSALNYTIDNSTWGPGVFNFTTTTIPAGVWYWRSWANATNGAENATNKIIFHIAKNSTNPAHTNITTDIGNFIDANVSTYSDVNMTINGYLDYTGSGTVAVWQSGSSVTVPWQGTLGTGTYLIRSNTTGNANYTGNATGTAVSLLVTVRPTTGGNPAGGGGSPTFSIPPSACEEYYTAVPRTSYTGYGSPGEKITSPANFTLQIYNKNTTQIFSIDIAFDDGNMYCVMTSAASKQILPNGIATFSFDCDAPNGTATGSVVISTDTGCTDSRSITLYGTSGFWADLTTVLLLLASGQFVFAMLHPIGLLGVFLPAAAWLVIMLIGFGAFVAFLRDRG